MRFTRASSQKQGSVNLPFAVECSKLRTPSSRWVLASVLTSLNVALGACLTMGIFLLLNLKWIRWFSASCSQAQLRPSLGNFLILSHAHYFRSM